MDMMLFMSDYQATCALPSARVRGFIRSAAFLSLIVFAFASCGRMGASKAVSSADGAQSQGETPKARAPHHKPADHRILVMLGPSFAGRPALVEPIIEEYGVLDPDIPESPGMMTIMTWPDSFMVEKHARLSLLKNAADDPEITIVATLGAPEGTVRELTRIHAARPDVKIVTLFAEDDGLPLEAVSDLLVDRTLPEGVLAGENSSPDAGISDAAAGVLLLGAVLSAEDRDATVPPLTKLTVGLDSARSLAKLKRIGSDWVTSPFVDPDTSLKSRNHLTIQIPPEPDAQPTNTQSTDSDGAASSDGAAGKTKRS